MSLQCFQIPNYHRGKLTLRRSDYERALGRCYIEISLLRRSWIEIPLLRRRYSKVLLLRRRWREISLRRRRRRFALWSFVVKIAAWWRVNALLFLTSIAKPNTNNLQKQKETIWKYKNMIVDTLWELRSDDTSHHVGRSLASVLSSVHQTVQKSLIVTFVRYFEYTKWCRPLRP